jgi:hybrid cluster-associated redox disulfide protein
MSEKISRNMTFGELMRNFPMAGRIISGYGLHCIGCHIAVSETIEEGARAHGLSEQDIEKLITELNAQAVN